MLSAIAFQIAAKMGSVLWKGTAPATIANGTLVVGIDVCHQTGSKSVLGVVAALGADCTKFYSTICVQQPGIDLATHMTKIMGAAINKYKAARRELPKRILVYRDGVGDSQMETFVDVEMRDIQAAVRLVDPNIKVTIVVVRKRIYTRMFSAVGSDYKNPEPGTVFDLDKDNFFLISQAPHQGTVLPSNYVVHLNEANIPIRDLQMYSYLQLHLYANWTGSIATPAVCQLAHKIAFLFGQCILPVDRDPESFADSDMLYFL